MNGWLGIPLFVRATRSLMLTEAGAIYLRHVHEVIEQLAIVTDSLPGRRPSDRLSVSVPPTSGWLVTCLDTPPSSAHHHPVSRIALRTLAQAQRNAERSPPNR